MRLSSRSGKHSGSLELNMTPMIDCVFLLLIFFMTTASFVKTERELSPGIVVQSTSGRVVSDLQPTLIEVIKNPAGNNVYRVGGRELMSPIELTGVLRQLENKSQGAYLRVSDDVPYEIGVAANQAAHDAGFSRVFYVSPNKNSVKN